MNYSEEYYKIKYQIEYTWPEWKINYANEMYLTGAHSEKLVYKGGTHPMKIGGIIKNDFSAAPGVCVTVF